MADRAASVLSSSEAESFLAGPFSIIKRVAGTQSEGAFEMYELAMGPATVDYHVHYKMDETIHVLEGSVQFVVAGKSFAGPAGATAFIPRGIHHGFTNPGPARARVLIVFNPSGNQHEYFRELESLFAAPQLDTAALAALQKRFDQELMPAD
jgi:quercetin dioxygenase-like cupin family protein